MRGCVVLELREAMIMIIRGISGNWMVVFGGRSDLSCWMLSGVLMMVMV